MTELEELEQRALTAIEDGFGNSLWATDLAQSRVGAAFDQARAHQAALENKPDYSCEDCGTCQRDVCLRVDPYTREMDDRTVLVMVCDECFRDRVMDT